MTDTTGWVIEFIMLGSGLLMGAGAFIKSFLTKSQERKDKALDYSHSEKVTILRSNMEMIQLKVMDCFEKKTSAMEMEDEVRKLIESHKMNLISQIEYMRHALFQWQQLEKLGCKKKEKINANTQS